ncbi:succinyl-diaminopimelate desuccinylase [Methylocella silvestris BL2]|uniref:Succinyl-diaminopimelate desuccinylase n=1 Tax=Methylocella silvestris (strain DSM 15510 / CIP 108128 / LMG 27833 / NCIMB 13906 / BL2) TaxID=395965 RepID=DAPE_METSB|nr:succinyl-diaminopimelate desuccinylase [Methylocella silvestris]B8ELJ6.1 RecName: Full=Succinyl-diaminopimelate desuccinylase; Short=SDAP desuccinylase; AltName: Full=N-succinyl-LL-2,6-diaminoheptanedioate amidohydrolase [Methylocella silvestris BL2]ACK49990.1 succinyl-diaminopimelate desuccinylase [Methylocella silvestris BL2]
MSDLAHTAVELCRELLRRPSVTPLDAGAQDFLAAKLREAGFATHSVVFSDESTPDIQNLYARAGAGGRHLVFAGHTDVVPPGDSASWRFDPFGGEMEGGLIFGRGAVDMKGAIAAFAAAAMAFVAEGGAQKGSISFLITGDEEGPAINGTDKLLRWAHQRGERFDHCILGEPTNQQALGDMIKIGRRGSLNGTLTVKGVQGHVAYPHRAKNPIPHLMRLLAALTAEPLDQGTELFDASNLEIVSVDVGNPTFNVIPAEARARFNIRFNDIWTPDALAAELRARAEKAGAAAGAASALHFEPCNALAFVTQPDAFTDLVSAAIEQATGRKPKLSTSGGTSDARFIRAYCPVLEFGLVGSTMHAVDERAPVEDISALASIYADILNSYFK